MKFTYTFGFFTALAVVGLFAASSALACPVVPPPNQGAAWTSVSTKQSQSFTSHYTQPVKLQQSAVTQTGVWFGDQADAVSKTVATQSEESAAAKKANQEQKTTTGSAVVWEKNKWPSWTTATTTGTAWQGQTMWAGKPIDQEQFAGVWQGARVDETKTNVEGQVHQKSWGATGDATQSQDISGRSQAQGLTSPPFPKKLIFDFGGKIHQFIELKLENVVLF
ncbi:MAG: hypothetical protein WD200_03295 [Candidatus Andersenbacteria bacterium]